jgi:hypothetical protein
VGNPENANLPIGFMKIANREIGVPGFPFSPPAPALTYTQVKAKEKYVKTR